MSKYDPLRRYLASQPYREFALTFSEIEKILSFKLPASAERPQWWANQVTAGHPQREAWRAAGYEAFLSANSRKVMFRRVA